MWPWHNRGYTASHCVILRHAASHSRAEGFLKPMSIVEVTYLISEHNIKLKNPKWFNGENKEKNRCTTIPLRLLITIVEITEYMNSAPITPNTKNIYIHTNSATWLYKNACIPIVFRPPVDLLGVIAVYSNESCSHKGETEASWNMKINL